MSNLLSLIIPVRDEQESILLLYKEITNVLKTINKNYEIIFVDDGSIDDTFEKIKGLQQKNDKVKVLKLRGNFGKSVALQTGFNFSRGKIILTLDGDLQDNPNEIPKFLKKIEEGFDLVTGWKKKRQDPLSKVVPSRILNSVTPFLTGVKLHDVNCGFKAYRREVIENLNLYGELYRFIPILAAKQNFKVGEVIVEHRPRLFGKSKFGWGRGVKGLLDLVTIVFLTSYTRRPGHFFGTIGLVAFFFGFLIGLYITYLRITTGSIQFRHPLLYLGVLLIIIGIQFISTGLLAEMIIFSNRKSENSELLKKVLNRKNQ